MPNKKNEEACSFIAGEAKDGLKLVHWCTKSEFERGIRKRFLPRDAECIMRLFFSPWGGAGRLDQIHHYAFMCGKCETRTFRKNLRMLARVYGLKHNFESYFPTNETEGKTAFIADIATHHHVFLHPQIFALLKLDLRYEDRVDACIGRIFEANTAIAPETNYFHPDKMTRVQKIRWSE